MKERRTDRGVGSSSQRLPESIEWPTILLALCLYGSFGTLTWFHNSLDWWIVLPLAAFLVAWQANLQHEVIHGHPTPWALVNRLIAAPILWLWLPFDIYKENHLKHHRDEDLTLPGVDPESYYCKGEDWHRAMPIMRFLAWTRNSLAGRTLLYPALQIPRCMLGEAKRLWRGELPLRLLVIHLISITPVILWVLLVCKIPLWEYLLLYAYAGTALGNLRSFLEHRAVENPNERTVIVEASFPFNLLFLNNNLHVVHHQNPGIAWYRLPALYRAKKQEFLALNGGYFYKGYLEIMARYLFTPKENPLHPRDRILGEQPRDLDPQPPQGGLGPKGLGQGAH